MSKKLKDRSDRLLRYITVIPHYFVVWLLWTVLWAGCAISGWMTFLWIAHTWKHMFHIPQNWEFMDVLHGLLNTIEFLLLIPLPGMVGMVVYKSIGTYTNPEAMQRDSTEREMALAKRLMFGILATVTGTQMLDQFLQGSRDLALFGSGAIIILSIAVYIAVALNEHHKQRAGQDGAS